MSWNLKLSALSAQDPSRLSRFLSGTILAGGGWVLSRSFSEREVRMSFEFERSGCIEIYTALIAAGLELSQDSHQRLTELCQCTRNQRNPFPGETVGIELDVLARAQAKTAQALEQLETA